MEEPVTSIEQRDAQSVLDGIDELLPKLRQRAQETEDLRRLPDATVSELQEIGFFRLLQPKQWGGLEVDPVVFYEAARRLASACGSTGWVYGLLASHQWLLTCFSPQAQEAIWADRTALAAGTYAPVARAEMVDGGYLASGSGSFCSGCDNAQWQILGGMIPQSGGPPQPGFFLLRTADIVIDDNWRTMGLCGTGSKIIVADKAFVPAHRTVAFAALSAATAPGMRAQTNPLYKQSFLAVLPVTIVVPLLGMAEGALADF